MPQKNPLWQGVLAAVATMFMWTAFSLMSRLAGKSTLTPYDIFALRLIVALLVLLPLSRGFSLTLFRNWRLWVLSTLCSLIYCPIVYSAFLFAPAAHGALLLSGMQPFLVSMVLLALFGTHPNRPRWLGLALIATGIACAARPYFDNLAFSVITGDLMLLASATLWALYAVFSVHWGYSAWTLTRFIIFSSALVYLPIYWLLLPKGLAQTAPSTILMQAVFHGLFSSILAMQTYLKAIASLGAERTSAFLALVPIMVGLLAVPLLNETLSIWLFSALFLVSSGSYISSRYGSTLKPRIRR